MSAGERAYVLPLFPAFGPAPLHSEAAIRRIPPCHCEARRAALGKRIATASVRAGFAMTVVFVTRSVDFGVESAELPLSLRGKCRFWRAVYQISVSLRASECRRGNPFPIITVIFARRSASSGAGSIEFSLPLRGVQRVPRPRAASLAPAGQFTFRQSVRSRDAGSAPPMGRTLHGAKPGHPNPSLPFSIFMI